jgi:hypothetical protein
VKLVGPIGDTDPCSGGMPLGETVLEDSEGTHREEVA